MISKNIPRRSKGRKVGRHRVAEERECWGRLPPWMAAELDRELEQELQLPS